VYRPIDRAGFDFLGFLFEIIHPSDKAN